MKTEIVYLCPNCLTENFGGNGDNTNDCFECGKHFHDTEVKWKLIKIRK